MTDGSRDVRVVCRSNPGSLESGKSKGGSTAATATQAGQRPEEAAMSGSDSKPAGAPVQFMMKTRLTAEAAIEPDPVHTGPVTKETQIIAIYGKGGIGKSFTLANLSYMMAQQGKKVLLIGCDPKSDTTSLLFGGKACPTIIETSSRKKLAGEPVSIGDVCFKRDGVFAMELGGPEVGRGCGGRGIIHGFETLEKLGFHDWGFDYVLLDFLGDVVCGGFGLPIARDMCQKVIVVGSNDLQSLYVANNVCSAVEYFRKLGGNVGVAGMVINKDDGTGEAAAFAERAGIPVLSAIPANEDIRRKSASYEIIGRPGTQWAPMFETLATNVAEAPPVRPRPLSQDELLGLFSGSAVGRDVVLQPATLLDMMGREEAVKPSLEVIYDEA
jgi:chlorophyllide a reductase subunit X